MSDARPLILKDDYVTPNRFWGIYRGVVENCSDPLGQGRLQVRVPLVYGLLTEDEKHDHIPTLSLPWATTLASGGGGYYDTGSQIPIQCGSVVAVQFEGGNPNSPVVMGTYYYHPENTKHYVHKDPRNRWPDYKIPIGGGEMKVRKGPNNPSEASMLYIFTPTRGVVSKSLKGHTIWWEDKDNAECFEIVDRCGQGIRMEANVPFEDNKDNAAARGLKSAFSDYAYDKVPSLRVMIRDGALNEILLERMDKEQYVKIRSKHTCMHVLGDRGRAILGDLEKGCTIEVDSHSKTAKIMADRIILDGNVKINGDLSVYGNTALFKLVKSYVRMVVNQLNVREIT